MTHYNVTIFRATFHSIMYKDMVSMLIVRLLQPLGTTLVRNVIFNYFFIFIILASLAGMRLQEGDVVVSTCLSCDLYCLVTCNYFDWLSRLVWAPVILSSCGLLKLILN